MPTDLENAMAQRNGPNPLAAPEPLDPSLPPVPVSDPFADYRKPNLTFDIGKGGKVEGRIGIEQLLANRQAYAGHDIRVVGPDDQTGTVPVAHLEDALAQGYKLENSVDTYARHEADNTPGLTGAVKAAMGSFANELFLGIPDAVDSHTGDDFANAAREKLRSEHRFASGLGALAGFAGSLAVGSPVFKLAGLAGEGAARLAERGIAEGLASRLTGLGVAQGADTAGQSLARSMVGNALKLGAESAVIAAPKAITEESFSDHQAAAETMLYSIGGGAALGALGSGAMSLFRRLPMPSFGAVAGDASGLPSAALDTLANSLANKAAQGKGAEVKAALTRAYQTDAQRVVGLDDVLEHGIRKISDAGSPVLQAEKQLADVAFTQKSDQMGAILREVNLADPTKIPEQWMAGGEVHRMVKDVLDDLNKQDFKGGIEGGLKKTEKFFKDFERTLRSAKGSQITNPEDMFIALDKLKRQVGKVAQFGKQQHAIPEGAQDFDDLYHNIRAVLEREPVWGKAAIAQKEVNAAYTEALATRQKFESNFVTEYGSTAGRPDYVFDPKKVSGFLNSIGSEDNALVETSLRDYAEGMRSRIKAIRGNYSMTDAEKAIVDQGEQALGHLETTVAGVRKEVGEVNQIKKLKELEHGKGIGGFLGLATDYFTRPVATAERLGHVAKWTDKLRSYANDKIGPLVIEQAMRRTNAKLDEIPAVLERMGVSKASRATIPSHAMARFLGGDSTDRRKRDDHFDTLSNKLGGFLANPVDASTDVGHVTSALAHAGAPKIGGLYGQAQLAMLSHLHETMPRPTMPPAPFSNTPPWKAAPAKVLAWERRIEVSHDPFSVYRHLEQGTLSREHVDTLQKVWPSIHGAMVKRITREASKPNAPKLPLAARQRLSMLLGMPIGAGTGTAGGARYQQTYAAATNDAKKGSGIHTSANISAPAPTDTQRLAG